MRVVAIKHSVVARQSVFVLGRILVFSLIVRAKSIQSCFVTCTSKKLKKKFPIVEKMLKCFQASVSVARKKFEL